MPTEKMSYIPDVILGIIVLGGGWLLHGSLTDSIERNRDHIERLRELLEGRNGVQERLVSIEDQLNRYLPLVVDQEVQKALNERDQEIRELKQQIEKLRGK